MTKINMKEEEFTGNKKGIDELIGACKEFKMGGEEDII